MMNNTKIIEQMQPMLFGEELCDILSDIPKYNENICNKSPAERLIALSTLYDVYLPSEMSMEIYSKLYLALLRSLQKKNSKESIQQSYQNYNMINNKESRGIIGGSDSFSIIGVSGIGKSSAINRAISVITNNKIIDIEYPPIRIIPCLVVQCPWDASVKSMLLEILRKADELLETNYYDYAFNTKKMTTDNLIGIVSQVSLQHIGLLIIDEIQNCVGNKNGKRLVAMLTQLINSSGISIGLVGTPETLPLLESALQLARRSLGLQYNALDYNEYFDEFCKLLWKYKYTKNDIPISSQIIDWLYEHSGGITSVVVSLIHDAQEIAILSNYEKLDLTTLNQAYDQRAKLLHEYINPAINNKIKVSKIKNNISGKPVEVKNNYTIYELVQKSKNTNTDAITIFKEYFSVEEVKL